MNTPFSVGEWRVDPALRQIARGTEIVRVDPRNLRVLQLLASRAGAVVSQAEIEKIAWSGVAVTPDSVYQSIAQLRRALGEDKVAPRYVETVPRKGYRLIAPVSYETRAPAPAPAPALAPASAPTLAEPAPAQPFARTAQGHRRLWVAAIGLAASVVIGGGMVWILRPGDNPSATQNIALATQSSALAPEAQASPKIGVPAVRTELPQAYQGDSDIRKAIAYLETQLKTQSETAGPDDPGLVTMLSRLANLYPLVSDPRRSEVAARRGLAVLEKLGGTRSDEGVELHATLAEALADLERYEEAEVHLQTALKLSREMYGDAHETTVAAVRQQALLRIAQRRFKDAEALARRALDMHWRLPEPGKAQAAYLTSTLALALIEQGRAPEAITLSDEALAAIQPDDPPAPYLVAIAYHFRGEALNRVGRHVEAEQAFRAELDLFALIPHVRMDAARAVSGLAEARLMQGATADAAELLNQARAMLKDGDGWQERKAREENEIRLRRLREVSSLTDEPILLALPRVVAPFFRGIT
jgi:DNA-binding winged helix-turn-helix (wHTH) protein/tetratricopeptide (TPR) repeat protein